MHGIDLICARRSAWPGQAVQNGLHVLFCKASILPLKGVGHIHGSLPVAITGFLQKSPF
jgi:hypothetical protein